MHLAPQFLLVVVDSLGTGKIALDSPVRGGYKMTL